MEDARSDPPEDRQDPRETWRSFFSCDWREVTKRRLPVLGWLPKYTLNTFLRDLLAGFTVALTEVPQGIAYADVAGLPLQYGLYCGFMGGFVYAIFGSRKDINIGPTSIMALMIQPHVTKMGADMAVLMTFLAGAIIFVLGLLHLGFVVEFFSYPIIAGFTCAGAVQIASTQIKSLLGIPGKADAFVDALKVVFDHLDQVRLWDSVLGLSSIAVLVALREVRVFGSLRHRPDWSRRRNAVGKAVFMVSLASNALVVIAGTAIGYSFRNSKNPPFKLTGDVDAGFPPFEPPPFSTSFNGTELYFGDMAEQFGTSFAFIPLVAVLEAVAIAKAFSKGKTLDATQELLALGLCNIFGSFVRSMPVTGSFTRTAVNNASGAKTTFAGVVTALMVLLAIGVLTPTFKYVPKATLASVVICAMFYLFDFEAFAVLWKNKKLDLVPFLVTLLCCIFVSLEYGILIGIGVNLLFVLYASARPNLQMAEEKLPDFQSKVYVITPKDTIFFPAAEHLRDTVLKLDGRSTVIVIDGKYIKSIDITVAKGLVVLAEEVEMKGQKLLFVSFKKSVIKVCAGIKGRMADSFRTGDIEDIVRDSAEQPISAIQSISVES